MPSDEVTPPVAVYALQKLIDLETDINFRNDLYKKPILNSAKKNEDFEPPPNSEMAPKTTLMSKNAENESFIRQALINMLLDIVYR